MFSSLWKALAALFSWFKNHQPKETKMVKSAVLTIIHRPAGTDPTAPFDPATDTLQQFGTLGQPIAIKEAQAALDDTGLAD